MGEIMKVQSDNLDTAENNDLIKMSDDLLLSVKNENELNNAVRIPIAELSTLGAGIASLIPSLRTITQTTSVDTQGLYQLANAAAGDSLKVAKNGNYWGAFKTAEGASKFAQLKNAGPMTATSVTTMPINPATILMAGALFSIEQKLNKIEDMEKEILQFLEIEKESQIEADVETLTNIISKYKLNWDNEQFISGNYKIALDILRKARENMIFYQKKVADALKQKQVITAHALTDAKAKDLLKKFKYYRLSLYTYALASTLEIILGDNYEEEYIQNIRNEIDDRASSYRSLFGQASAYLEKMGKAEIGVGVLKGIGNAGKAAGKFIGSIPVVKEGPVDEFLQDGGKSLTKTARNIESKTVKEFSSISNPGTGIFTDQLDQMIQIYAKTNKIAFDRDNIYLIAS